MRIAFREEGFLWNVYLAKLGTMEGAVLMASINLRIAREIPEIREKFMELMQDALTHMIKEQGLEVADWNVDKAPDHERSGKA